MRESTRHTDGNAAVTAFGISMLTWLWVTGVMASMAVALGLTLHTQAEQVVTDLDRIGCDVSADLPGDLGREIAEQCANIAD